MTKALVLFLFVALLAIAQAYVRIEAGVEGDNTVNGCLPLVNISINLEAYVDCRVLDAAPIDLRGAATSTA